MTFARHMIVTLLAFGLTIECHGVANDMQPVFETDVQPILAAKCGKCHAERVQKGGLDLSTMTGIRRGGESGESALAESVDESMLWIMIDGSDMPPEDHPQLTGHERDMIRQWIVSGATAISPQSTNEQPVTQHDVMPIMLLRCTTCHGARKKEGGVDLRTPASMLKGGKAGPAIVPGDPSASLVIQRIESEACPPRELLLKFFIRRPSANEVDVLRDWIANGATESDIQPDVATTEPDPLVTDEDRQHWAFQSLKSSPKGTSIDELLLASLHNVGLTFSPEANRDTLIRRAYVDLIGLPPSDEDRERWIDDMGTDWYRRMIDHLLASPHYGERWGRFWLDLAGYADSEGGVSADPLREVAWKYRDYVVRAFNDDKPYDRFLVEQLAGDELTDHENAHEITHEMVDNLIATGFLRMGIDQTGSRTMNFVPERIGVISDAITIVSEGLMGLTMGCARCHSHKYDPIPHRDYYRLKAIFQGALDEHDWLTFKNRELKVDVPERVQRVAEVNPKFAAQIKQLEAQLAKAVATVQLELLRQHYPEQSQSDRDETLRALRIADNNRSQPQRILVELLQQVEVLPVDEQPASVIAAMEVVEQLRVEIRQIRQQMEPPLTIRAMWDRGEPSPTYILRRGEHDKPGRLVGPGVPSVLTDGRTPFDPEPPFPSGTAKTGRRLAFARWLTQPDHPLTSRVMVNRIWYHHFGTGIIATLENFGVKGDRPSHPELLDWLASEFVSGGWSVKDMHRLIMNSRAYRQSSRVSDEAHQLDPQNRLLSRMSMRRLNAEAVRDSLLSVAGRMDTTMGGMPDPVQVDRNGLVSVIPRSNGSWRRSIYLQFRRTEIPSMMEAYDYPEMGPNCLARNTSTVSPQSLMMMNNEHVYELAKSFAERVQQLAANQRSDDENKLRSQVTTAYQLALCRTPSDEELRLGIEALNEFALKWQGDSTRALETYCHTIFNSAAFVYVD